MPHKAHWTKPLRGGSSTRSRKSEVFRFAVAVPVENASPSERPARTGRYQGCLERKIGCGDRHTFAIGFCPAGELTAQRTSWSVLGRMIPPVPVPRDASPQPPPTRGGGARRDSQGERVRCPWLRLIALALVLGISWQSLAASPPAPPRPPGTDRRAGAAGAGGAERPAEAGAGRGHARGNRESRGP